MTVINSQQRYTSVETPLLGIDAYRNHYSYITILQTEQSMCSDATFLKRLQMSTATVLMKES